MNERSQHILIADDDANDVLILRRSLVAAGVNNPLHVVRDGAEAIDYLAGHGRFSNRADYPFPDVMLLDLKMPKLDGFDVLIWCRQQTHQCPVSIIVLSGSALPQDIERARDLGARAYRVKPTDANGLTRLAEEFRDHWLARPPGAHTTPSHTEFFIPDPKDVSREKPFNDADELM